MAKHIDLKDNADELSKDVAIYFEEARDKISAVSRNLILNKSTLTPQQWYKYQNSQLDVFRKQSTLIIRKAFKNVSKVLNGTDKAMLNNTQRDKLLKELKTGFNDLHAVAIKEHKSSISGIYNVVIHSNVSDNLYETIMDRVNKNTNLGYVTYQNGKNYHWESWMETKVRTEIQTDIAVNMVNSNDAIGTIFYTTSFYGNCAEDHADFQGKIYVTENWESMVSDELKEQVSDYIASNKIMTIQDVMNGTPYLTTRPNCRHFFQPVPTEEILKCKSNSDVKKLRDYYGLNFAGSYKPEKYEALQKQRYLERQARSYDERIAVGKDMLEKATTPVEKQKAQLMVKQANAKYREKRAAIDDLVSKNEEHLVRSYKREHYNTVRGLK